MLVSRLQKKFPNSATEPHVMRLIEGEVNLFCASEHVTKESMKQLESRISRKLLSGGANSSL